MSNNNTVCTQKHMIKDPVVFVYPNGKTQIRGTRFDKVYGVKLDGKRPVLIMYPIGLASETLLRNLEYIVHPTKGQIIGYEAKGIVYEIPSMDCNARGYCSCYTEI